MRIGVIGIGDICEKAYLPVLAAREDIELILCTRKQEKLEKIKRKYRIAQGVQGVEELIEAGVDGAFVHTSTESHVEIVTKLLQAGIPTYVDKPISYYYEESEKVVNLAKAKGIPLMVGFNRRYTPLYSGLYEKGIPDMMIMEKNRVKLGGESRVFILDDFIHVVDTLLYLMQTEPSKILVKGKKKKGLLSNVTIMLSNEDTTAVGIMNRDSGITEETLEYMKTGEKYVVEDLAQCKCLIEGEVTYKRFKDWDPTLYKRGFETIVDEFLQRVKSSTWEDKELMKDLYTHFVCEKIVIELENLQ